MLKSYLSSILFASLFAVTTVYANDHQAPPGGQDPANEMGDSMKSPGDDKNVSGEIDDADPNKEKAESKENAPHPAHEMGEHEEIEERGGQ